VRGRGREKETEKTRQRGMDKGRDKIICREKYKRAEWTKAEGERERSRHREREK